MKKLIIFSLLTILIASGCTTTTANNLTIEEAKIKAVEFINKNLMANGQEVSVKEITEDEATDMYKIVLNVPGSQVDVDSYLTKDGSYFFPQTYNIAEVEKEVAEKKAQNEATQAASIADVPKTDTPNVELFVMSHCPYGTQIEKGIIPVIETLGDKIDFELKFCDYAMHQKVEIDEQLNQYCIQKNEKEKLLPYLRCFLTKGEGAECLKSTGINTAQLASCVKDTDNELKISYNFENNLEFKGRYPSFNTHKEDVTKYNVGGSPTLVINGKTIRSGRDSKSLLTSVCGAFENAPEECSTELSATSPSAGFGWDESGSNSAASCGS